jgi:hypothetical protein
MMGAIFFLQDELTRGSFGGTLLTSAWAHMALLPHLEKMIDAAERIVLVSGMPELLEEFARRFSARSYVGVEIPPEFFRPPTPADSHHARIPEITKRIVSSCEPGTLVIAGAGMFANFYCAAAKRAGAVALNVGSALDVLAGKLSRPVHGLFDVDSLKWVDREWSQERMGRDLGEFFEGRFAGVGNTDGTLEYPTVRPGHIVYGWGYDYETESPMRRIVLVDDGNTIVGIGRSGEVRDDVVDARDDVRSRNTGWTAFSNLTRGTVRAFGISNADDVRLYPLGAVELPPV